MDLILCSSDYPDPPPHDERLRIYYQNIFGRFEDVTDELGLDHLGAGMPSLGDIDGDGDLDLLIGQSFNRLTTDQRRQAAFKSGVLTIDGNKDARPRPSIRLFENEATGGRQSLILNLIGDPSKGTTMEAYGTIVQVTADIDGRSGHSIGHPTTPGPRPLRSLGQTTYVCPALRARRSYPGRKSRNSLAQR